MGGIMIYQLNKNIIKPNQWPWGAEGWQKPLLVLELEYQKKFFWSGSGLENEILPGDSGYSTADENSDIEGENPQSIPYGEDGSQVEATTSEGYNVFVQWSDGVTSPTRTDTNITENTLIFAYFEVT